MKNKYLIMTNKYLGVNSRMDLADIIDKDLACNDYDGLPTDEIKKLLKQEMDNTVVVSADSRMLDIRMFHIDNIYIYNGEAIKPIRECTRRILRAGHNLYKLYNSGEFKEEN